MGNAAPMSCSFPFDWTKIENTNGTPLPGREGHAGVHHDGSLYFFGGIQDCADLPTPMHAEEVEEFPTACMNDMYQYNINNNEWCVVSCSGDIPSPRSAFACGIVDNRLFVFGGLDPLYGWMTDGFVMDFGTKKWTKLNFTGEIPSPRDKMGCVVYDDKLLIFGGFGPQEIELEEGEEETATFGWFNDSFLFDIHNQNRWTQLTCSGELPTARAAPGVTVVERPIQTFPENKNKEEESAGEGESKENVTHFIEGELHKYIYVIGGRDNKGRKSDVFSLDLNTLMWTEHKCRGTAPIGRSFHSCSTIKDKVVLFGGASINNKVLNDIHILDTRAESSHAWVQPKSELVTPSKQPCPRAFHAALSVSLNGQESVFVHGGTNEMDGESGEHLSFSHDLWKLPLDDIKEYRAPSIAEQQPKEEKKE